MKTLAISVSAFIIIIFTWFFLGNYISNSTDELIDTLNTTSDYITNNNWDDSLNEFSQFQNEWDDTKNTLEFFSDHGEIRTIDNSAAKLEQYIKSKSNALSLGELYNIIQLLSHIKDEDTLTINNVF